MPLRSATVHSPGSSIAPMSAANFRANRFREHLGCKESLPGEVVDPLQLWRVLAARSRMLPCCNSAPRIFRCALPATFEPRMSKITRRLMQEAEHLPEFLLLAADHQVRLDARARPARRAAGDGTDKSNAPPTSTRAATATRTSRSVRDGERSPAPPVERRTHANGASTRARRRWAGSNRARASARSRCKSGATRPRARRPIRASPRRGPCWSAPSAAAKGSKRSA